VKVDEAGKAARPSAAGSTPSNPSGRVGAIAVEGKIKGADMS